MSKRKLAGIIVGCVIVIAAIAAPLSPRIVTDYSRLLNYLHHTGASIREGREHLWPGSRYLRSIDVQVNEKWIDVTEYANANVMKKGEPMVFVEWIGKPGTVYFFREGRIQVMYIADYWQDEGDKLVISLLEDALGKPYKVITEEDWREKATCLK